MWYDNEISMGIMERKYLHPGEKPEEFIPRVTSIFSEKLQPKVRQVLENADFLPAGRTLFGAGFKGKRKVSISNCYILPEIEDDLESIFEAAKMIARISSYGGGCGLSIDKLRPKNSKVNNAALTSSGAVSFLNVFDVTGSTIGQNGRRAALMVGLRCDHPDIEEFLNIKRENNKLASMNISIKFTNEFMEAVENDRMFTLKFDSEQTGLITKEINARKFFKDFCECAWDYGDPGCIFIDRVRQYQLLSDYKDYRIDISNPCSEYFGNGGNSCNLGSINVYNVIDEKFTPYAKINYKKLQEITDTSVRMLDEILDYGYDMQPLDLNRECIRDWRSIGLGIFGFADALVAMGIRYGSDDSRKIASDFMETILKQAIETSCDLAKEKGPFEKFNLESTLNSPLIQMFPELKDKITQCGMRNGSLLSIAPTGTISLFAGGFTGGIEPMYKIAYERASHQMEEQGRSFFIFARGARDLLEYNGCSNISPEEAKKRFPFLIESHEVPYMERVYFQGAIQDYVDNAISSTVNLPNEATADDVYNIYMEAWKQGLKGITVFRDGCKRASILGINSNKKDDTKEKKEIVPEFDSIDPPTRRTVKLIEGATARESTSCVKSMYVTVNRTPDNHTFEVFTNASGGCKANINTISRLCSLALRGGIKVSRVIDELRANQCPACQLLRRQGRDVSISCSNAIADAMEAIIGKKMVQQESPINNSCPECGKRTLIPEGKCVTCTNCGWSKCE